MSLLFLVGFALIDVINGGILYPRSSETREVLTLDGLWRFSIANKSEQDKGFIDQWFSKPLQQVIICLKLIQYLNIPWISNSQ